MIISVLSIFLLDGVVLLIFTKVLYKNRSRLHESDLIEKFGAIYEGRTDHKLIWLVPLSFAVRRIVFIIVTIFAFDRPSIQMMMH